MAVSAWIQAKICTIEQIATDIKLFTLQALDGVLPPCRSGSHIVLQLPGEGGIHANAYSLLDSSPVPQAYRIAVKLEQPSSGGSQFLHRQAALGMTLPISAPANLFALADCPAQHVFIAGGIGITPFIAHMAELDAAGGSYELHYAFRGEHNAAFAEVLRKRQDERDVYLYDSAKGQRLEVEALLDGLPPGAHVYVCGPQRLIEAVEQAGAGRIAPGYLHVEHFAAQKPTEAAGFTVQLARSGCTVTVLPDESILAAIERQTDVAVESMCREGYCGSCETTLLAGEAVHYDQYLDEEERASQCKIMLCVSRAKCASLTLDL